MKKNNKLFIPILIVAIVLINILSQYVYKRFDLTEDKRYTLSDVTENIILKVEKPLEIEVLLDGEFPGEFRKLREETQQILEEYSARNSKIFFRFHDPMSDAASAEKEVAKLVAEGIKPLSVNVNDKGKQSQEIVFPWAIVRYGEKSVKIPLIKNVMGTSIEEKVQVSVQHLEYAISEAIQKLVEKKSKKIAIIKGIGEPQDVYIADLLLSLRDSYYIAPFTLDSVAVNPIKTLKDLQEYDLAIVNKPTQKITDDKIQVLDQFVMNGGKTLWMVEEVQAEMDSLHTRGEMLAYPKETGLGELFFRYGIRINPVLIKDEQSTPIKLAVGRQGSETFYDEFIWKYAPFANSLSQHPIVKNIEGVKFDFANSIDTLKNSIKKSILLQSSPYSMTVGTPSPVSLSAVNEEVVLEKYQGKGNIPLAVLLEGNFRSVFRNRILPFKQSNYKSESVANKMIVVADGDVAKNQIDENGLPMETGYDKWTNNLYGNKEFVLNSINYLLDDSGLIQIRTKDVKLPLLNKQLVYTDYFKIQLYMIGIPLLILLIFGILFYYIRKKMYLK